MPWETSWEENGVCRTFSGRVDASEVVRSNLEVYGSPRFRGASYQILDFSGISDFDMSQRDVMTISEYDVELSGLAPGLRTAFITTRDDMRRLGDLYRRETLGFAWEFKIFGEMQGARRWVLREEPSSAV